MKQLMMTWRKSEQYQALSESLIGVLFGLIFTQIAFVALSFGMKSVLLPAHLIGGGLFFLAYALLKDQAKESHLKMAGKLFYLSGFLLIAGILNGLMLSGMDKVTATNPDLGKQMFTLLLILDVGILVGYLALVSSEKAKESIAQFRDASIWEAIIGEEPEEVQPGDAVIGRRVEMAFKDNGDKLFTDTELPVVLPVKDRYLHMLVLGPTGSGKTSQIIIPMINRDMQNENLGIIAMEPKGDLAEKVFAMAFHYGREVQYFNPILPNCPYFNPLYGLEEDVVENMATTFKMLDGDSSQFFQNMNENLIRNSLKVLKRLYANDANMLDLYTLVHNNESKGKKIIQEFSQLQTQTQELQKENDDIVAWFLGDYFTGSTGDSRGATKTYEHCSGVRSQIAKLVSNKFLRKVLNPPRGHGSDVDFDDALEHGKVIAISTAQGKLRDLGRFLGYFLILQLQSSVFRRPGNEDTRRGCMLYIDEFQVYSNPGFADMLTQGRSYRVASHLATQARDQIGMGSGKDGDAFIQLVSSNARNVIVFPGGNYNDAKYYSDQFGQVMTHIKQTGLSQQKIGWGNAMQFRPKNEMTRLTDQLDVRFTPSDIIYREFGEITHLLIKNNTIQAPGIAKISYIPMELNTLLGEIVEEHAKIPEDEDMIAAKRAIKTEEDAIENEKREDIQTSQFKAVFDDIDRNEKRKKAPQHKESEEVDYSSNDGLDEEYNAPVKSSVIMDDEGEEEEWF